MTDNHPITPPPELVIEWWNKCTTTSDNLIGQFAAQAARWGADQELEACCADLRMVLGPNQADWLRSVRRPKPPSLKELALEALDRMDQLPTAEDRSIIRRALESLSE